MGISSSPTQTGAQPPICSPCLLWPNGWMDQDATWYGGRPRARRHCVRRGPAPPRKGGARPPQKGARSPKGGQGPQFSAHVYCDQRSPITATAELLFVNMHVKLKPFFRPECSKYRLATGLHPDPLGKFTALPKSPIWIKRDIWYTISALFLRKSR